MSCVPLTSRCRSTFRDRLQGTQCYHQQIHTAITSQHGAVSLNVIFREYKLCIGRKSVGPEGAGPYVVSPMLSFCPMA